MAVKVHSFSRVTIATREEDFDHMLREQQVTGCNSFWISHEEIAPVLLVLTNQNFASLHYMPDEREPGYESIGRLNEEGEKTFFIDSLIEPTPMPSSSVITLEEAVTVAKEFFRSTNLPRSISWREL